MERRPMTTDTKAVLAVLQQALELEERGQEFYAQAAERTVDAKGKETFLSLASDEVLHQEVLQRQVEALGQGEGWVLPGDLPKVDADLNTPLFPEGKVEFEKAIRSDASDMDALLFALKLENDSFALYAEQARSTSDPNARRLFEYLVDAERTHFDLLMSNYESLNSRAGWVG
jgi:rubrerythrin